MPCASEVLDPVTPQYLADLLSWAAIGARTTESQTHREMASGLSMPVGFKNGTDGQLETAGNAMRLRRATPTDSSASTSAGVAALVRTRGNPDGHLVLRGGGGRPNYDAASVAAAARLAAARGVARGVLVDCSHDNSGKRSGAPGRASAARPSRSGAPARAPCSA